MKLDRWWVLGVFALACGDDEPGAVDTTGSGDVADSEVAAGDAADAVPDAEPDTGRTVLESAVLASSQAVCERAVECAPFFVRAQFGGSEAACVEREYETLVPVIGLPGVKTDPAGLENVAVGVRTSDCEAVRRGVFAGELPVELRLVGTLADGAACSHQFQCASGSCRRTFDKPCGTCETPEIDGAECANAVDCRPGLTCAEGKCASFGEHGDACDAQHPCYPHDACPAGECASALTVGAECSAPVGECDLQGDMLVCGLTDKHCIEVTWVEAGAPCGYIDDDAIVCSASACVPSVFRGTCMAYAADGAARDTVNGPLCAFHASCIEGRCQPFFGHACESP